MKSLTVEVPDELLVALQEDLESFAREFKIAAAVKWYELGKISQDRAAELAGLSRAEFLLRLGRYRVSAFQETADEVMEATHTQTS